ncbi:hypothetical protein RRG08_000383 [Elysia crispata]|uniref:Uncharacterized protein n=1 Tax=Elysia crispata TaxID=231223 RepID=A0AAE1E4Z9_9GAST|nr:hypothetical protein RRG08_000383 [Elysia crispata]
MSHLTNIDIVCFIAIHQVTALSESPQYPTLPPVSSQFNPIDILASIIRTPQTVTRATWLATPQLLGVFRESETESETDNDAFQAVLTHVAEQLNRCDPDHMNGARKNFWGDPDSHGTRKFGWDFTVLSVLEQPQITLNHHGRYSNKLK